MDRFSSISTHTKIGKILKIDFDFDFELNKKDWKEIRIAKKSKLKLNRTE